MEQIEMIEKKLKECIDNMDCDDLKNLHNEWCYKNKYYDDEIFYIDDVDVLLENQTPSQILQHIDSDFNINHTFCKYDGYGYLQSFSGYDICDYIYTSEIIDYIISNNNSLNNDEIDEILNDFDGGDDDE